MSVVDRLLRRADAHPLVIERLRRRHLPGVMPIEAVSYPRDATCERLRIRGVTWVTEKA